MDTNPVRAVAGGVAIEVWAVPGASKSEIVGLQGDLLKVRVTVPPEQGRANEAIADLLGHHLGVPLTLSRGITSRHKTYLVIGIEESVARGKLGL